MSGLGRLERRRATVEVQGSGDQYAHRVPVMEDQDPDEDDGGEYGAGNTVTLGKRVGFRGPSTPNMTLAPDGAFSPLSDPNSSNALWIPGQVDAHGRRVTAEPGSSEEEGPGPSNQTRGYGWRPDSGYEPVPSQALGSPGRRKSLARIPCFGSRKRLHPLTLLPAFAFGLVIAYPKLPTSHSHSVPATDSYATTSWASTWTSTLQKPWSTWRPSWPTTGRPTSSWDRLESPYADPYTVHPTNGHVYLSPDFALHAWRSSPAGAPPDASSRPGPPPAHPILTLMQNASSLWHAKLSRQSRTLSEAVAEYKRRHRGRNPPKGFDKWWEFVSGRGGVKLVDEYDRIWETIEPFWALDPSVIRKRREPYLEHEVHNTFIVKDGQVTNVGGRKDAGRANDQLKLMEAFLKHLPDVNITMSHHDGPSVFLDHAMKTKYLDLARAGQVVPEQEVDLTNNDVSFWGFPLLCSRSSRLHLSDLGLETDSLPSGPSFIGLDHAKAMDLCENPEWQYLHGFTAWAGPRPTLLNPIFSFASLSITSDLLATPLEQFADGDLNEADVPKWAEKKYDKVLWKGRTTGVWFDAVTRWRSSQRMRLHSLGTATTGSRKVRFSEPLESDTDDDDEGLVKLVEKDVPLETLNRRYLNASFVGKLEQCTVADGSCEAIPKEIEFGPYIDWPEQNMYKYVLDVDGNSWSGRFRRLLASHSVVFKTSIWPEWYRDHIQPWYHYVPTRIDYSDLYDLMAFFTGDLDGRGGHDALAQKISENGEEFVRHHWRTEDLQAYTWRMYLEWARVSSDDRTSMDFVLDE